ncbi:hypothetical protein B0A49_04408 [Cryomyces minteri]|uniref:Uncharacterized protein n=1 Tax=Cryomyces minteri TaxID=331657 RepID=A0A4U0X3W4_9PEZI|nr:hypothetical protein B0A49_04408 [Cryomyces minteri]
MGCDLSDFKLECIDYSILHGKDRRNEIVWKVLPAPGVAKSPGFIRIVGDKNGLGWIQFVNRNARLQLRHLRMGCSTKTRGGTQAGHHGEGFKLAAVVLRRHDHRHSFQIFSSGRVWKMQWNKGNGTMDCVISAPETLSDATRLKKITPEPDIFKDVCMEIGKLGGQNYKKISVQRMKQTLIYKSMDFSLSKEVIHTSLGDLVCDDVPTGHVYIKGLRLRDSPDDLHFIYNLTKANTDRDRRMLSDSDGGARYFMNLWNEVFERGDEELLEKNGIVPRFAKLLMNHPESMDVKLAEKLLCRSAATKVWKYLVSHREEGQSFFYYRAEDPASLPLIHRYFERVPRELPKGLWNILIRNGLCRTFMDHCRYKFRQSSHAELPDACFAQHMAKALDACFASNTITEGRDKFRIVKTPSVGLDLIYEATDETFMVDVRWFDFVTAHKDHQCERFLRQTEDQLADGIYHTSQAFSCDHAVITLLQSALEEMTKPGTLTEKEFDQAKTAHGSKMRDKIQQMPRGVQARPTEHPGELFVSWEYGESELIARHSTRKLIVTLHCDDTCGHRRGSLLFGQRENKNGNDTLKDDCDYQMERRDLRSGDVVFRGLESEKRYFPTVVSSGEGSFYAVCPPAIAPYGSDAPSSKDVEVEVLVRTAASPPVSSSSEAYSSEADDDAEPVPVATDAAEWFREALGTPRPLLANRGKRVGIAHPDASYAPSESALADLNPEPAFPIVRTDPALTWEQGEQIARERDMPHGFPKDYDIFRAHNLHMEDGFVATLKAGAALKRSRAQSTTDKSRGPTPSKRRRYAMGPPARSGARGLK